MLQRAHVLCNDRLALILTGTWKSKKKAFPIPRRIDVILSPPPLFLIYIFPLEDTEFLTSHCV